MPFRLVLALLAGVLVVATAVIFATGQDDVLLGRAEEECRAHTVTRHRSGREPRSLAHGLQRRVCGYDVRAARRAARAPEEFDFVLLPAERLQMPGIVDSNSPAFWNDGSLRLFNSAWEQAHMSLGDGIENLGDAQSIDLPRLERPGSVWLESVWLDPDTAVLHGWYHFEPADLICQTAPIIGAAVSYDLGETWEDRGFVLDTHYGVDCDYDNGYFSGGNGDFSVIQGPGKRFFYFFYTAYSGPLAQQGVAVARGPASEKGQPGSVSRFYNDGWTEPGIGGRHSILFGTSTGWKGPLIESFWGPSVHWNTYLNSYVVLLNHTDGEQWVQEGVYIAFSKDLVRWTEPRKILEANDWYPQVIGTGAGETDSVAGREARLYVGGISDFVIQFSKTEASGYIAGGFIAAN